MNMGRQTAILATQPDVADLVRFMKQISEIAVFVPFAETIEELSQAPIRPRRSTPRKKLTGSE